MLCKGDCGKESIFSTGWCSDPWYICPGYRLSLSLRAKKRGNNGAKGILSKKYYIIEEGPKEFTLICGDCNKEFKKVLKCRLTNKIYLCKKCAKLKQIKGLKKMYDEKIKNTSYEKLSSHRRKKIVFEEQGFKCNSCNYNLYDITSGPYELHHKDGNANNTLRNNEEVLCCNCHAMTKNYRFKNRSHNEETKSQKFGGIYTKYKEWTGKKISNCEVVL